MDNTFKNPTIISIGPGMRGIERGIERAIKYLFPGHDYRGKKSVNVAAYVEIESFIIWNLVEQMEKSILDETPVWVDVKTFPFRQFHEKIHGITAGYPCQPFSTAGQRKGEDDPRHIFPYIREGIRASRPIWAFFENVPGHLSLGYDTVRKELSEIGYAVEEGIFSAEEVGATHQRKRLFILAIHKGWLEIFGFTPELRERIERYCKGSPRGNTESNHQRYESPQPGRREIPFGKSSLQRKMGNSSGERFKERRSSGFRELSTKNRERIHDRLKQPGFRELDNSIIKGLEGHIDRFKTEKGSKIQDRSTTKGSRFLWPARPGQPQYEWEEPRTQPRMGCSINGYNFREDLLRMYGNGVVEQTAEKAFITILGKHINNLYND